MSKILGSWSGMRKYLEQEMLAPSLNGRVRYNCTRYVGMDNCHIFELYIDGELFKQFSWETVNTWFLNNGYQTDPHPYGISEYWSGFWELVDSVPMTMRDAYTDNEFCEALEFYRNHDVQVSLEVKNPICIMFALLDRRTGKRSLQKIGDTIASQPVWLKDIYELRINSNR